MPAHAVRPHLLFGLADVPDNRTAVRDWWERKRESS
jgi:hypothetical protein